MTTTFVTAFYLIKEYKVPNKSLDGYFNHFILLAKTGIPIVVYIDPCLKDDLSKLISIYNNVKLIDTIHIQNTWTYQTANQSHIQLPINRNLLKDSFDYMVMQNAKLEFCSYAIQKNQFNTPFFAWIDFGIFH